MIWFWEEQSYSQIILISGLLVPVSSVLTSELRC